MPMASPSSSHSGGGDGNTEDSAASISRDQVISIYMESARQMRKRRVNNAKGRGEAKKPRPSASLDLAEGQLWLSVAKMKYDSKKGRGVQKKGKTAKKMFLNKEAEYETALSRIREELYGELVEDFEYYLSDSSGLPITTDGKIVVHKRDGSCESHTWTIKKWMNVSGIRYQSRARLYCVQKPKHGDDDGSEIDDKSSGDDTMGRSETERSDSSRSLSLPGRPAAIPVSSVPNADNVNQPNVPDFPSRSLSGVTFTTEDFEPLFGKITKSRYLKKFLFLDGLTQQSALADPDFSPDAKDILENQSTDSINPCSLDFTFHGIRTCETISLIKDYDEENGCFEFDTAPHGAELTCWSGGYVNNDVAILVCFALNGYHQLVSYKWFHDKRELIGNGYPVLYTRKSGEYECVVNGAGADMSQNFSVVVVEVDGNKLNVDVHSSMNVSYASETVGKEQWKTLSGLSSDAFDDTFKMPKLEEKSIGEGTFGTVHRAIWRGTVVAAKLINVPAGSEANIQKEIAMCKSIQHPNILRVLGSVVLDRKIAILSNLVEGGNLQDLIQTSSHKLSFLQRKSMGVQLTQTLAFLHTNSPKIVHLDVKPANVLVEANSHHVYLADFGVAKVLHQTLATIKKNSSAGSIGTPGYQPIEQLQAGVITESVDVYALGCVLIELFGEQRVWEGLSAVQVCVKVVSEKKVPTVTHLQPQIQQLVGMCLKQRSERATSIQVLSSLLRLSE